ncbi:thiamine-phosphate kinase [Telmatobacter sp. DSM 110680]|uniref:Thiamine-monophosphate kinase n=1 Tax=Telmatobacter sp. DSM 110680 TaxID=3036704 RepID=A0AAU7DH03_9BACT
MIRKGGNGELALIDRIRGRAASSKSSALRLGIGDDCALLRLKADEEFAVTTDLSIAGRHFKMEWHPPRAVGHRTLARGLSDLAAMGARPVAAFLSLGLPRELTVCHGRNPSWVDGFLDGFLALADQYRTPLAGGDLAESPVALADVVLVGAVPLGRAMLRSGARPGDLLCVTGALGGAAAGLELLRKTAGSRRSDRSHSDGDVRLAPHLWPLPRIVQGLRLRQNLGATAAIDLSDGLSTDLNHLCQESGVSAEVDAQSLPIHTGASLEQALHGGEDYELLFTVRPDAVLPRRIAGVRVSQIGRITKKHRSRSRVVLLEGSGRRSLTSEGWQHFS